jgi:peroxiredoxin
MRLGLLILFSMLLVSCAGESPVNLNIGQRAPSFQTVLASGAAVAYPGQGGDRPVLLFFWAEWCPGCTKEMKDIEALYLRHRDQGLAVLAVNVGQDTASVQAFMRRSAVSYPALLDETSAITRSYGVTGLPTAFLIDAQGIVRGKVVGEVAMATMADQLAALLK